MIKALRWSIPLVLVFAVIYGRGAPLAHAEDTQPRSPKLMFDMETVQHRPGLISVTNQQQRPIGTVGLVPGAFGKAVQFSFTGGSPGFMTAPVQAGPEWDKAQGFSFYLKGDGSTNWGGLELVDRSDYSLRYAYCFPLDSTEWGRVVVDWGDLTPELAAPVISPGQGYAPSGFGNFWFGKWFYWRDYPAHSFVIDHVSLEGKRLPDAVSGYAVSPGLKRVQAKLRAAQPVTIITMGDSLSDKRHWANRTKLWSELLAQQLEKRFHSRINLVNPAIGGTTLSQNLVLLPRWLRDNPAPDLVTVWFGYNDWDSGVRGGRFSEYLALAVDRIRRKTGGAADILLLTTCPSFSRWETMRELEDSVRHVADQKQTDIVDIAAEFRQAGSAETAQERGYWAWDKTHLGPEGHELVARAVFQTLAGN